MKWFSIDDLVTMNERSTLFNQIKAEMKKRGHWKAKDRGISGKELERKRQLRSLDMQNSRKQGHNPPPTYDETQFNDGL